MPDNAINGQSLYCNVYLVQVNNKTSAILKVLHLKVKSWLTNSLKQVIMYMIFNFNNMKTRIPCYAHK